MRNGEGCIKEIECSRCAHFPFICNGKNKPSKMPKSKVTQLKRGAYLEAMKKRWCDI